MFVRLQGWIPHGAFSTCISNVEKFSDEKLNFRNFIRITCVDLSAMKVVSGCVYAYFIILSASPCLFLVETTRICWTNLPKIFIFNIYSYQFLLQDFIAVRRWMNWRCVAQLQVVYVLNKPNMASSKIPYIILYFFRFYRRLGFLTKQASYLTTSFLITDPKDIGRRIG